MSDQDRERFFALHRKAKSEGLTPDERAEVKQLAPRFAPAAKPKPEAEASRIAPESDALTPALIEANQQRDVERWWVRESVQAFLAEFGDTEASAP